MWAKVLHATPRSRLLLKAGALNEEATRQRLRDGFAREGIDAGRLDLLGHVLAPAGHLALYSRVDIALDTYPYHGTTTTCEALWMGVPVVTLAGQTHASRVGVSLLTNAGVAELIAVDVDDFVQHAIALASETQRLAELRRTMRDRLNASPLRDEKSSAQRLEAVYRAGWRAWCARGT
jgi:protein O-GlcNAc transferase